jgi:hypothetical protein
MVDPARKVVREAYAIILMARAEGNPPALASGHFGCVSCFSDRPGAAARLTVPESRIKSSGGS